MKMLKPPQTFKGIVLEVLVVVLLVRAKEHAVRETGVAVILLLV
jgi:hypothetical protein